MDRHLLNTLLVYTFVLLLFFLLYTILSPFLGVLVWAGAISISGCPCSYPPPDRAYLQCTILRINYSIHDLIA